MGLMLLCSMSPCPDTQSSDRERLGGKKHDMGLGKLQVRGASKREPGLYKAVLKGLF